MAPLAVTLTYTDARMMLKHLTSCFGVRPQALLLPRQPGCGRARLCELGSLRALVDLMVQEGGQDLSQHTEVFVAHHSPEDSNAGQLRVFHRPAIPCYAGSAAGTLLSGHKLASTVPNTTEDGAESIHQVGYQASLQAHTLHIKDTSPPPSELCILYLIGCANSLSLANPQDYHRLSCARESFKAQVDADCRLIMTCPGVCFRW